MLTSNAPKDFQMLINGTAVITTSDDYMKIKILNLFISYNRCKSFEPNMLGSNIT